MTPLSRLLPYVFLQSIAATLVSRVAYFLFHERLEFTDDQNLALAVGTGLTYIGGALPSHWVARRFGERRTLLAVQALQAACVVVLGFQPPTPVLVALMLLHAWAMGVGWPIAESYSAAGRSPTDASRAVGLYNIAWSTAAPIAVATSGALIALSGTGMFWVAGGLAAASLVFAVRLPAVPAHHPPDHPDRPAPAVLARYRALMWSSRWSMVASYALLFVATPLMPGIFAGLGFTVVAATLLASSLDVGRGVAFAALMRTQRWHGLALVPLAAALLQPVGFLLILHSPHVAPVVAGTVCFGVGAGLAYCGALYYALVVSNASVEAGGHHESLIGSGLCLGPLAALVGRQVGAVWHTAALGATVGIAPVMGWCLLAGLWPLRPRRPQPRTPQRSGAVGPP